MGCTIRQSVFHDGRNNLDGRVVLRGARRAKTNGQPRADGVSALFFLALATHFGKGVKDGFKDPLALLDSIHGLEADIEKIAPIAGVVALTMARVFERFFVVCHGLKLSARSLRQSGIRRLSLLLSSLCR